MIHIFGALKSLLKPKKLHIDHWTFRLHYRFTVLFLLLFCIVVSTKQYAGEPIKCSKDTREYSVLVETYCFVTATYTVKTAFNKTVRRFTIFLNNSVFTIIQIKSPTCPKVYGKLQTNHHDSIPPTEERHLLGYQVGYDNLTIGYPQGAFQVSEGAPHPGIYPAQDEKQYRYHRYYQWVGFILFIQAIFFYTPHWLWKIFEGGKISSLLERDTRHLPREEQVKSRDLIVQHLRSRWTKDNLFIIKYLVCEICCFINIFGQMAFLDGVFENEFFCLGFEVMSYYRSNSPVRTDPLLRLFPRVTSCTYRYFGEGAKIRSESVLCVLAVNVMNEKIFLFLWFWFIILSIITFCALVFKIAAFSVPSLRLSLLCARFPCIRSDDFKVIVETGNLSNYLLINLLGQNMEEANFLDVIEYFVTIQRGKLN
ncbi:innexin shaking-B [Caerostris darwini]|uniref:Innexin n=1 Tax=Caerostris darwini TaxID=1538125 RepID=A0AAV4V4P8_9ARAC|nr:innexin shaking-B [Caerostris darwini]